MKKLITIIIFVAIGVFLILSQKKPQENQNIIQQNDEQKQSSTTTSQTAPSPIDSQTQQTPPLSENPSTLSLPISNALARVTKKPFGIYITPQNSPVNPEKFKGYHTGVDFETTPEEQDTDVPIYAICTGELLVKKTSTGYGGVVVQKCNVNNQAVTVIYGHLKLASIQTKVNQEIKAGDVFAILGKGFSSETSGERKHLHLGIHKGSTINILGYVQNQSELSAWLNILDLLK